jgi:hypothetical protein
MVCPLCHGDYSSLRRTTTLKRFLPASAYADGQRIRFVNILISEEPGPPRDLSGTLGEIKIIAEGDPDWTPDLLGQIIAYPDGDEFPVIVPPHAVEPAAG